MGFNSGFKGLIIIVDIEAICKQFCGNRTKEFEMAKTTVHEEPFLIGSESLSVNNNMQTCTTSYPGKRESTTTLL